MKLAIDAYYYDDKAKVVGILFTDWKDSEPVEIISEYLTDIADYESGSFYKRELPCIMELLRKIDLSKVEIIIVDSFVYLDDNQKLGLGGYLYQSLEERIPVIGVAKNSFHGNNKNVLEIFRGDSKKPLYISSIGIDLDESAILIHSMHGDYRFPTLLRLLDTRTKDWSGFAKVKTKTLVLFGGLQKLISCHL